ncbi:hypothetical protein NDU88_003144 [Pleurodeles waltl]|uniref:Secreted protein n=1 Tax=Pleurodeles waltl TaxID=8319 RepID=A0AAV7M7Z0_PLEWA|nr:hypothetical protein NDU88_003144 [Pleurodeles waltl]
MSAMSVVVALSEHVAGLVVSAGSVAEMLPVVHVSAPVEGDSRTSPAASYSCPLEMMLGTVGEAADVQVAVQVAVSTAIQVAVLFARRLFGTLAALMGAVRDVTGLAETTVLEDLVTEVLGWDLDILALGEGRGKV